MSIRDRQHLLQEVSRIHTEQFNTGPVHTFFAPGRINLIGEHVDYNEGFVLPAAIHLGIAFAIARNHTDSIRIFASDVCERDEFSITEIYKRNSWMNYTRGVFHEFQKDGKEFGGVDIVFMGNLPQGAGLSSSAALECGLAFALNELFQWNYSRKQLALLCQRAEHGFPGVKCGIMDQFSSLMGKKDHCFLLDCRDLTYDYYPANFDPYSIVLIRSGVHHSLVEGEYNQRRADCEAGVEVCKKINPAINSLRDVPEEMMDQIKEQIHPRIFNRCRYVIEEIERTRKATEYLQKGDSVEFGKLLFETHWGLSRLYEVSTPEIDFLVEQSQNHPAVIGSRIMGGGFGGCTLNLVKKDQIEVWSTELLSKYKNKFGIEASMIAVQADEGVGRLS
jgi:galactokinase